ncbi:MAG: MXAN_2562 family outer membrane beta-barrel protein [Polyangiales bacterium]
MRFGLALGSLALLMLCGLLAPAGAAAQIYDEITPHRDFSSPEHFALEVRVGPYQPDMGGNKAFTTFFGTDHGPMFAFELDVVAYRLKDVLYLNGGAGMGTASYLGHTLDATGLPTAEKTTLSMLPINLLAVLRVDVLARKLSVPFIFAGKIGYQWAHWNAQDGKAAPVSGWSVGMRWAAQVALDLDAFDQKAARRMDEEWGINHSLLFFELFQFKPSPRSLPLGSTAWTVGLGFSF